jgi:hypothetical protein
VVLLQETFHGFRLYFIDNLRPDLPADGTELLEAIVTALNDSQRLTSLEALPAWRRSQAPRTLNPRERHDRALGRGHKTSDEGMMEPTMSAMAGAA